MHWQFNRLMAWFAACLALGSAAQAGAACNNPNNWLEAPGPDTKLFIGYKQDRLSVLNDGREPYPPALPQEMLSKSGPETLPKPAGYIAYYEPNGKSGWRVCREDRWGWLQTDTAKKATTLGLTAKYRASNSALEKLTEGYSLWYSKQYFYDSKGRIERIASWYYASEKYQAAPVDDHCLRYDDQDRVILSVEPRSTLVCPKGEPDPRDLWARTSYYEGVDFSGNPTFYPAINSHSGKPDGTWTESFKPFWVGSGNNALAGNAEADSQNGVTVIYGSNLGKLDDNAANTVINEFGHQSGTSYFFTKPPVPLEVLKNPELIYQYERRRQTIVEGSILKLFELFKPNEHISRHRYYLLDGYFLRHEQLDEKGRVTRVITVNDWRQKRPGPNPDVNDKLLTNKGIRLFGHQIYHRVYDIDASGKPTLVAISWNRARRINPLQYTAIDAADVAYGTPDGKERWKTQEAFEKSFNTSWRAAQVFPDKEKNFDKNGALLPVKPTEK